MSFKFSGLDNLSDKLEELYFKENKEIISTILNNLGILEVSKIRSNFTESLNPYGESWRQLKNPSKKRGGISAKTLLDTGRLVGSINYNIINNNILEIGTPVFYAQYHQTGDGVTKRSFLPEKSRGLPESWNKDITDIIEKVLKYNK